MQRHPLIAKISKSKHDEAAIWNILTDNVQNSTRDVTDLGKGVWGIERTENVRGDEEEDGDPCSGSKGSTSLVELPLVFGLPDMFYLSVERYQMSFGVSE
jgi:hypothetical protein